MKTKLNARGRASIVIDTLAALGDYLRTHKFVTGCGFERTDEGILCHFQNCRFVETAHSIAEQDAVCAKCPVFDLAKEALQKRGYQPTLQQRTLLSDGDAMCVFRLSLETAARDDGPAIDRGQEHPENSPL